MTVVAPTDRPKSVRNRSVIERFAPMHCRLGVFVTRLRQISSLFSLDVCVTRKLSTPITYLEPEEIETSYSFMRMCQYM